MCFAVMPFSSVFRKSCLIALLILGCAGVGKGWYWAKDGFHFLRLQISKEGSASILCDSFGEETRDALSQPYHYLARGKQCYAFESQDGRYILKLPRMDRYGIPLWLQAGKIFFSRYREALEKDHLARRAFLFESFRLSFRDLKEETAVLALHLEPTVSTGKRVLLKNRLGFSYWLPLDRAIFVLQEKKSLLSRALQEALAQGNKQLANQMVEAWVAVVAARARQGILNKDGSFLRNFGYAEGKAYQIDIGSFYRGKCRNKEVALRSMQETMKPIRSWLSHQDLQLAQVFDDALSQAQQSL
jgi:hypothetical protein